MSIILWTHLEHLNESNTEVKVCLVTADQTQTEEEANWHDRPQVHLAGHGHLLSRVKDGREARKNLRHDGCKDQMPCCEEDGKLCRIR